MGEAGGGEGKVGERGSMAGKVDWEKPCPEGRFPLTLDYFQISRSCDTNSTLCPKMVFNLCISTE